MRYRTKSNIGACHCYLATIPLTELTSSLYPRDELKFGKVDQVTGLSPVKTKRSWRVTLVNSKLLDFVNRHKQHNYTIAVLHRLITQRRHFFVLWILFQYGVHPDVSPQVMFQMRFVISHSGGHYFLDLCWSDWAGTWTASSSELYFE